MRHLKGIFLIVPLCGIPFGCCTSAPSAKALSSGIVAGQAAHQKVEKAVHEQLVAMSQLVVAQTIDAKKQQLQLVTQASHAELYSRVNDAFITGLYEGFDIIDKTFEAEIQKEGAAQQRQLQLAAEAEEAKVSLVHQSDQDRQSILKDGNAAIDAQAAKAQTQIDAFTSKGNQFASGLKSSLDTVDQHTANLVEGTNSLDAYIQRQSEVNLIFSGFLSKLGIDARAVGIDKAIGDFTDTLGNKLDSIVDKASASMGKEVETSSGKAASTTKSAAHSNKPTSKAIAVEVQKPKPQ